MLVAFAGFVYLVLPGVSAPPLFASILMTISGIAWGMYTLKGKSSFFPLGDTAYNFLRTLPLVAVLVLAANPFMKITVEGVALAVLSGAITSGIGYTIWYMAMPNLSATQAAVVQLSVPVIAAFGGVVFVGESIGVRLVLASLAILGGIMMVFLAKKNQQS